MDEISLITHLLSPENHFRANYLRLAMLTFKTRSIANLIQGVRYYLYLLRIRFTKEHYIIDKQGVRQGWASSITFKRAQSNSKTHVIWGHQKCEFKFTMLHFSISPPPQFLLQTKIGYQFMIYDIFRVNKVYYTVIEKYFNKICVTLIFYILD